jgi:quercetin dioxygenase-like cupin family protein
MKIKKVLELRAEATGPVAKVIHQHNDFKAIAIGLKKGITWKDHKSDFPATLIVSEGEVVYKECDRAIELFTHDSFEIPVGIVHSLEAREDSLCFVIQG